MFGLSLSGHGQPPSTYETERVMRSALREQEHGERYWGGGEELGGQIGRSPGGEGQRVYKTRSPRARQAWKALAWEE